MLWTQNVLPVSGDLGVKSELEEHNTLESYFATAFKWSAHSAAECPWGDAQPSHMHIYVSLCHPDIVQAGSWLPCSLGLLQGWAGPILFPLKGPDYSVECIDNGAGETRAGYLASANIGLLMTPWREDSVVQEPLKLTWYGTGRAHTHRHICTWTSFIWGLWVFPELWYGSWCVFASMLEWVKLYRWWGCHLCQLNWLLT